MSGATRRPVLGESGSGAGVVGKGYRIPKGSLDTWKAARAASAAARCEVLGFGDSLIWGQGPTGGAYSFLQRLRERAAAAGLTDGGRGLNAQYNQTTDNYTGEPAPISAQTGFNATSPGGIVLIPGALVSNVANDSITFKVVGTQARLWFSRYSQAGRFSYSVNGGASVTAGGSVELPPVPVALGGLSSPDVILLGAADGMVNGTNTIVVTNLGGNPATIPVLASAGSGQQGAGNVPNGTYYYVATRVQSPGETTQSNVLGPITVNNGGATVNVSLNGQGWAGTYNLYRGTSSSGPFGFVGQTTVASGNTNFPPLVDNSASTGAAPPSTNTAGLDSTNRYVAVAIEALKDAGIVWQNHGVQGQETDGMFGTVDGTNNAVAVAAMGLQWGNGSNGLSVGTASETLPSAAASGADAPMVRVRARKPSLVVIAYGTNDIQKAEGGTNPLGAPTVATAGTGIGSGLAAATYFYKVQRVVSGQFGGGPLSPATSGVVVTAGQQVAVTAPILGAGNYVGVPVFNVYRATSSGGTYGFVGQIVGASGMMLDNTATPGAAPASTSNYTPIVDTSGTENAVALAIRLARNAGADPLVVLPSIESLNNSRTLGGVFKAAIQRVAETYSCAWVDFDIALGPTPGRGALGYGGGSSNPHLLKPAYVAQGDFLWDNVLSPTALP